MKTPIDYILNLSKEEFKFLLSTYKEQRNKFNRNYIKKSDINVDLEKLVTQGLLIPTFSKEYYMGPMAIEAMRVYNQMVYLYINYDKVEGNPVPSLDNDEIKFIIKVLEDNIIRIPTEKGSPESIISSIHNKRYKQLISKLQNGRETDKEQPNPMFSLDIYSHQELEIVAEALYHLYRMNKDGKDVKEVYERAAKIEKEYLKG